MAAYQPIQMGDDGIGSGLDSLAAILMANRKSQREQEQHRAELLLRKQSEDRQMKRIEDLDAHTKNEEERRRNLDFANVYLPRLRNMVNPQHAEYDPESAAALASAAGIKDFKSIPDPGPGPAPVPQAEYGPRISPEDAQASAIASTKTPPSQPEARADEMMDLASQAEKERQRFAQANDPNSEMNQKNFQGQQAAYQNRIANPMGPTYRGMGPTGEVNIDPNATQAARREQLRRQAQELAPLADVAGVSPAGRLRINAMIQAGATKADLMGAIKVEQQEQAKEDEKRTYHLTAADQNQHNRAMERAAMAAAGARKDSAGNEDPAAMAALAQWMEDHPGDVAGAYRAAAAAGIRNAPKAVGAAGTQGKSTESQQKDAKLAGVGLRAMDDMESSAYQPSREEIQTWLNNQRKVDVATKAGSGGGLGGLIGGSVAGGAQSLGIIPQSEFDGLTPQAQAYFANTRRVMEGVGREASGAAINPSEWTNFYNQYGPSSPNGKEALRKKLNDQARLSGAAGRQISISPDQQEANPLVRARAGTKGKSNPVIDARKPTKSIEELAAEHGL